MIEKLTPSRVIFNIINYGILTLLSLVCIAPVWHVLMASFSDPRTMMATPGLFKWIVGKPTLEGYRIVLNNPSILTGYRNTLFYVVAATLFSVVMNIIGGFALSRKTKLKKPLTIMLIFSMMFSGGLIPSYMVNMKLGFVGNPLALIIPGAINGFHIILMMNAFNQVSSSYEESAKLDGAGPLTILVSILLPLVKATVAVIVMFMVVQQWNSWFTASIYLSSRRDLWPLQLFMREILVQNDTKMISAAEAASAASLVNNLVKHCVTVVGTFPILLLYPFAQKYFVKGITLGGVKG